MQFLVFFYFHTITISIWIYKLLGLDTGLKYSIKKDMFSVLGKLNLFSASGMGEGTPKKFSFSQNFCFCSKTCFHSMTFQFVYAVCVWKSYNCAISGNSKKEEKQCTCHADTKKTFLSPIALWKMNLGMVSRSWALINFWVRWVITQVLYYGSWNKTCLRLKQNHYSLY